MTNYGDLCQNCLGADCQHLLQKEVLAIHAMTCHTPWYCNSFVSPDFIICQSLTLLLGVLLLSRILV